MEMLVFIFGFRILLRVFIFISGGCILLRLVLEFLGAPSIATVFFRTFLLLHTHYTFLPIRAIIKWNIYQFYKQR
jgi:hypothetical protein